MKTKTKALLAVLLAAAAVCAAAVHAQTEPRLAPIYEVVIVTGAILALGIGGPLLIIMAVVIVWLRLSGRRTSTGSARSTSLRKGLNARGKRYVRYDRPGQRSAPSQGRIILDSSAALDVMAGKITTGSLSGRVAITPTVRREIDGVSLNNPGYSSHLPGYKSPLSRGKTFSHYLREFDCIQKKAAGDPTGSTSVLWLKAKQRYLDRVHGITPAHMGLGGAINEPVASRALSILYRKAKNDRTIVAEAASQAGPGAAIMSSDGDILAFYREISEMTGGRLKVVVTDALSSQG